MLQSLPQISPVVSASSYWMPVHFPYSAWVEHGPFAAWLIDAIRPSSVVELGTHNGYSFFAFAEAVRRLGLPTQLTAIDSWEGDDHAGFYAEEVYEKVAHIAANDYPSSTRLLRAYFSDAAREIPDGSVDLLHIDGRHGYEDVLEDFQLYRPKLSERGVVIFHDTQVHRDDFGVFRFWEEIAPTAPSFEFLHGHGLGVLVLGSRPTAAITEFLAAANADPDGTRDAYSSLGRVVADHSEIGSLRADLGLQKVVSADLERTVHQLRQSVSWRLTRPLRFVRGLAGRATSRRAAATPSPRNPAN